MGVDKVYLYKGRQGAGRDRPHGAAHRLADPDHREGLNVGDTIITSGTLQLRTDLPVKLDTVE